MVRIFHNISSHAVNFQFFEEPRYASLPNIMKAKKKPVEKLTTAELGIDLTPRLETIKVTEPPKRVGGGKVTSISTLYFTCLQLHPGGKCGRASRQTQRGRHHWQARLVAALVQSFSLASRVYYPMQGHYKLIFSMCRTVQMTTGDLITMALSSHNISLKNNSEERIKLLQGS